MNLFQVFNWSFNFGYFFYDFSTAIAICSLYMSASCKSCRLLESGFDGPDNFFQI